MFNIRLTIYSFILFAFNFNIIAGENPKKSSEETPKEIIVAVATNFSQPIKEIAEQFEKNTSYKIKLVFASSGQLFSQISHGAPYHLFLSADQIKPKKLAEKGLGIAKSQRTYAIGSLVLWANKSDEVELNQDTLKRFSFSKLAIANPKLAPYGLAAKEVLRNLNIEKKILSQDDYQLIRGENISQTYQFVKTNNVDLGLIALSQVINQPNAHYWLVPKDLYQPIRQDLILLKLAKDHPIATSFMAYLLDSEESRRILSRFGYSKSYDYEEHTYSKNHDYK